MSLLPASIQVLERDWLSSNNVLLFDGRDATIVDTGHVKHADTTVALVRHALAARGARLARIVNTHLHSDHCGGNAALAQAFAPEVWVPGTLLDAVARWDDEALTYKPTGQRCARFSADRGIAPGDRLTMGALQWQALAAPGHDPDSLLYFCKSDGVLISADALWHNGFGIIFPELQGIAGFADQAAVLDLIESLHARVVIPGHGPVFDDVPAVLARAKSRLAAMRANPQRHAQHAMKVMAKYQMLDLERASIDVLVASLAGADTMHGAARLLGADFEVALRHAVDELVAQGQLLREGELLVEPAFAG